MLHWKSLVSLGAVVASSSLAVAAPGKPLPAAQHQPPVAMDATRLWVNLVSRSDSGYGAHAKLRVMGVTSKTDRVRLDWKAGGKVIGTSKCSEGDYREAEKTLDVECSLEKDLKAKGAVDVDVIYSDDQADQDYLVTTLKLNVKNWKGIGPTQYWGIIPDDLLALGWVVYSDHDAYFHRPMFGFWTTDRGLLGKKPTLRCTVNGTKLPDIEAQMESRITVESSFTQPKVQRTYAFERMQLVPKGFYWGTREAVKAKGYDISQGRFAIDNPGAWDCAVRVDGKAVRQLKFTIDDKGLFAPSELQTGSKPLPLSPDTVLVDLRIPADHTEVRVRQDALKKSVGYGLPWPDGKGVKDAQAAFPKSMGLPD